MASEMDGLDGAGLPGIVHPLKLFDIAKSEGRLLYTSAPMVRYSKLAFRQTVHAYGTDLCWTPMILAKEFNRSHIARDCDFTISTSGPQPPTIVQFGSNSPLECARAASLVAPYAGGVDLNCGCPQSWACAETLGAALMDRRELVRDVLAETRARLRRDGWAVGGARDAGDPSRGRSVSVKIRVHRDLRRTVDFVATVLGSDPQHEPLVDFLTVHPRTRHTPSRVPADLEALRVLTSTFGDRVPILLSGDVFDLGALPFTSPLHPGPDGGGGPGTFSGGEGEGDAPPPPHIPKLAGLMSARGILANPALYAGYSACPWEAVEAFMARAARAPLPFKLVLHHLGEMCGPGLGPDKSALLGRRERAAMLECANMCDLIDFLDEKIGRRADGGWGLRRDVTPTFRRSGPSPGIEAA